MMRRFCLIARIAKDGIFGNDRGERTNEEKWVALICGRGGCRHPGGAAGDG